MHIIQRVVRSIRGRERNPGEFGRDRLRDLELRLSRRVDEAEVRLAESIKGLAVPVRRRRLDLVMALILLLVGIIGGWLLYFSAVPRTPVAGWAGVIGVGVVGPEEPVQVVAHFWVTSTDRTEFRLVVGPPTLRPVQDRAFELFFCGPVRLGLRVEDLNTGPLIVRDDVKSAIVQDSRLGNRDECVTVSAVPSEFAGQSFIVGSYDASIVHKAGSKVLYALPGVTTLGVTEERGGITLQPLPDESTISVSLEGAPPDLSVSAASPLIPDAGSLSWEWNESSTGLQPPARYRIAGVLDDAEAEAQWRVLIAGTLIALAGSCLMWLVQLLTERSRRRAP